jgi:HK97 family phage major capsid protein
MAQQLMVMVTPENISRRLGMFDGKDAKAMGITIGSAGGFLLPEEFITEVQRKLVHTSVMTQMIRTWPGVEMQGKMPRETGTVSVYIADQLVSGAAGNQPTLGNIIWALQKRLMITQLPKELWKFSGIDVLTLLSTMFAEQAQKTNDYFFLLGSGSLQPTGLLTNTIGMNSLTMEGTALQWQDTIDLKGGIKSQYRLEKNDCAYMANDYTIRKIAKLTDDQKRPVFLDRGKEGIGGPDIPPQTLAFLNGHAVLENPYVPGPVAETLNNDTLQDVQATTSIIFANFKRGYSAFLGPTAEIATSDVAYDAFINEGLYTKYVDYFDGKPNIPQAVAILTGVQ